MVISEVPEHLPTAELKVLGVWGLTPFGECLCPRGTRRWDDGRDHKFAEPGACDHPGKHPWWAKLASGEKVGFPHGLKDAVSWEEWHSGLGDSVAAGDGRAAYVLPGNWWVLDSDNHNAFGGIVKLIAAGRLPCDRVAAVDSTPRGWHVWVRAEKDGWTTGTAQRALDRTLEEIGARKGLEVKSAGSYVVAPDGRDRYWVAPEVFATSVAFRASLLLGPPHSQLGTGSGWKPVAGPALASGTPPVVARTPVVAYEPSGDATVDALIAEGAEANLRLWCVDLAYHTPEGQRNSHLYLTTVRAGRAALAAGVPRDKVLAMLLGAGVWSGLTEREVRSTVASGLRATD